MNAKFDVVTGSFSYTGKYLTKRLIENGRYIRTLTGHPNRANEFGSKVEIFPFDFDTPKKLVETLRGADTVYNTYWVRFPHGKSNFDLAVENTKVLMSCAKEAGVKRFVHVSIANPDINSPLAYYKGKAILENYLKNLGISYAIIRPTVIFGKEDILINNIAWCVRTFPLFAIPGNGEYRIQPIFVEDMANLMAHHGTQSGNVIVDAVGPVTYTFKSLVKLIASRLGRNTKLISLPASIVYPLTSLIGLFVGDVVLTKEEIEGLMADLLASKNEPTGQTKFSEWLDRNMGILGKKYSSEVKRHFKRVR